MEKVSRFGKYYYKFFTWIHTDSDGLIRAVGCFSELLLKLARPSLLKEGREKYDDYVKHARDGDLSARRRHHYNGCKMIYGVDVDEYFVFQFWKYKDAAKRNFITNHSRFELYERCNTPEVMALFDSKFKTYCKYREYFKREAMLYSGAADNDSLRAFLRQYGSAIVKPDDAYCGIGVELLRTNGEADIEEAVRHLETRKETCIVEEFIRQSDIMAAFHPGSVNTIRIPAYRLKNGVVIHRPFLRTGQGGSVVDNAGAGGAFAAIDADTGLVISLGIDELGYEFLHHPDSGKCYVGFQIPDWDQVVGLTTELMQIDPDARYVGWDFAHTDAGWVVVEGNPDGQFVGQQMTLHSGCRNEVLKLVAEM